MKRGSTSERWPLLVPGNGDTPSFIAVDFLMPCKTHIAGLPVGGVGGGPAAGVIGAGHRTHGAMARVGVDLVFVHRSGFLQSCVRPVGAARRPQALMGLVDRGLIKPAGSRCPMTRKRSPSIRRLTDDAITQVHPRKPSDPPALALRPPAGSESPLVAPSPPRRCEPSCWPAQRRRPFGAWFRATGPATGRPWLACWTTPTSPH